MKNLVYIFTVIFFTILFSACTSYNYYTAAINKTNLNSYHTFGWMPQTDDGNKDTYKNQADIKIKDAATIALTSKGLQQSQINPDLIVSYTSKIGRGSKTVYYSAGYPGWGYGWGLGWGWNWAYRPYYYNFGAPFNYYGATVAENEHYKEGTLIIDLIDSHTHKIVWRGFGVGEAQHKMQKHIDDLPKVVDGILSQLNYAK